MVAFLAGALLVFACFGIATGHAFPEDTPGVVVLTSLVTMTFIAFFVEHYFGTPSTVMATAVSALLLLLSAHEGLAKLGPLLWVFVAWCLVLIGLASAALILLPPASARGSRAERARRVSARLKRLATDYGNARIVFGFISVSVAIAYLSGQPALLAFVVGYTVVLLGVPTHGRGTAPASAAGVIGALMAVGPGDVVTVECSPHDILRSGDSVAYALDDDGRDSERVGVVSTTYQTIDGLRAVVLGLSTRPAESKLERLDVVRADAGGVSQQFGIVVDGSSISSLKVDTLALAELSEGSLLSVEQSRRGVPTEVLYQIVDASVETDAGRPMTVAKAVQLGVWDEELCGFRRHGWVPPRNTFARASEGSCCTVPGAGSIVLGHLPGTQYPVIIDRDALRGGHIAILGVTGCGKSVTARYLLRQLATDQNHRIVVIDLTGEYKVLVRPAPYSVVSPETRSELRDVIQDLAAEMSEFPNKRDRAKMEECQKKLEGRFRDALEAWLESDADAYALLELPGFENTANSLEYTRWFMRALFRIAQTGGFGGKSVTVVLEEAHTVVPEWNFAGVKGDKAAEGLLNSIAQIALQGRKYGIGFVVITQRTANVSKTVLTQCASVIAFRSYDNTGADFLSNYIGDDLSRALPNLADREAIVAGSAFQSQVPLICRVLDVDEGAQNGLGDDQPSAQA